MTESLISPDVGTHDMHMCFYPCKTRSLIYGGMAGLVIGAWQGLLSGHGRACYRGMAGLVIGAKELTGREPLSLRACRACGERNSVDGGGGTMVVAVAVAWYWTCCCISTYCCCSSSRRCCLSRPERTAR